MAVLMNNVFLSGIRSIPKALSEGKALDETPGSGKPGVDRVTSVTGRATWSAEPERRRVTGADVMSITSAGWIHEN
jgi:hypothetical protein